MRIALVYCPYLTSGDSPPLGVAAINAALLQAGHEPVPLDFAWQLYWHDRPFLHHLRQAANLGQAGRRVQFVFAPELLAAHLFGPENLGPAFARLFSPNPIRRQVELTSLRLARRAVGRWLRVIADLRPDAVFFSAYISNLMLTLPLAMAVKRELGLPVVLGGPGVSLAEVQDFVLRLPADPAQPPERGRAVDVIVVREGETTVVEVAARLADLRGAGCTSRPGWQAALSNVAGVAVLDEQQRLHTSERPLARTLDELPRPSFAGLPLPGTELAAYGDPREHQFAHRLFRGTPVGATRGCVNHCAYCSESAYWQRYRQRSVASLLDEMDQRRAQMGARDFLFCDSAVNGNRAWLMDFCAAAAGRGYAFLGHAIPGRGLDAPLAHAMARAGFTGVSLGVETLCEHTLRGANKDLSRAEVDGALEALVAAGIEVKVNILCGFPGETDADHEEAARELRDWVERDSGRKIWWDAGHAVRLEPHSPYWNDPARFGISIRPYAIDVPPALEYLAAPLGRLTYTWDTGVSEAEVARRCERLRSIAAGESRGRGLPVRRGASVSPILRRCLALVAELDLAGPSRRDLVAALQAHAGDWLNQWQYAGVEAGLARDELLLRGVALHFVGCALDLLDDVAAGRATCVPAADAPLTSLHLHNGFLHALARSTVTTAGAVRATRLLCDALAGCHSELDEGPPEARYLERARAAGGRRIAACLRLLWDGTPMESEAEATGAALGFAAAVLRDADAGARRWLALSEAARGRIREEAAAAAALVGAGSACIALRELAGSCARRLGEAASACRPAQARV